MVQLVQALICLIFIATYPLLLCIQQQDFSFFLYALGGSLKFYGISFITYFINFYWAIPHLLFKERTMGFVAINMLVLTIHFIDKYWFYMGLSTTWNQGKDYGYFINCLIISFVTQIILIFIAIAVRYFMRWNELRIQLQEEKQRSAEAELTWLKNQLNPHFLFNTLNNISSLVQIDADKAQDSISQLSDLLRYALYNTNQPKVPIQHELEFIQNYINLMKLRSASTQVSLKIDPSIPPIQVIPLFFISPIENAFKHSYSSREPSVIDIQISYKDNELHFTVTNSYHPESEGKKIGSGIGVDNLLRRLELSYPGNYEYHQEIKDNLYCIDITLRNCA